MKPALQIIEQRREVRRPASGAMIVRTRGPKPVEVVGRLVDVSASGFRMAHDSSVLETGALVDFTHGEGSGTARVVWNRISGDAMESGFFVVVRG